MHAALRTSLVFFIACISFNRQFSHVATPCTGPSKLHADYTQCFAWLKMTDCSSTRLLLAVTTYKFKFHAFIKSSLYGIISAKLKGKFNIRLRIRCMAN